PLAQPKSASACVNAERRGFPSGSFSSYPKSTPMRRTRSTCCARAANGHAAAPPRKVMNSAFSFDHLVRAQHYRWGDCKTESRGGLAVPDHLEFCRQLPREIARLFAAQNAIDIGGGATKGVHLVESVGEQTAVSGKDRLRIDRRHVVSGRRQY